MSNNVKNMIDAIKQGNYSTAQSEFKSAIAQKVSSSFESKKIEIASQMTEGAQINEGTYDVSWDDELMGLEESKSVPDKHQEKIAKDTLKNPNKSLMGGPSAKEAEEILRNKFGYSTAQIKKLKEASRLDEKKTRQLKDPDKEVMVVKNGKVEVIDKKDLDKYMKKGYELAEGAQSDNGND